MTRNREIETQDIVLAVLLCVAYAPTWAYHELKSRLDHDEMADAVGRDIQTLNRLPDTRRTGDHRPVRVKRHLNKTVRIRI